VFFSKYSEYVNKIKYRLNIVFKKITRTKKKTLKMHSLHH
jgi:hypothetical protein